MKLNRQFRKGVYRLVEVTDYVDGKFELDNGQSQKVRNLEVEIPLAFGKRIDGSGYNKIHDRKLWILFKYGMDSGYRFSFMPGGGVEGLCLTLKLRFTHGINPAYGKSYESVIIEMLARKRDWV
mgnify:CR=1 FL=1